MAQPKSINFVDLFAGCGGLTEGFYQEGYNALLHLEFDPTACETLKERMRHYGYSEDDIENAVLCKDITDNDVLDVIAQRIKNDVDLIIGGPPCQAFSSVGRAQDPNSMNNDPRNYLFENYLKVLNFYKPKFFIFENVKGILTARPKGVKIFDLIISEMRKTYKVCDDKKIILLDAANYGVPQHRERVILIGVRNDIDIDPADIYKKIAVTHGNKADLLPYRTVRDAIGDLPALLPGEGTPIIEFEPAAYNDYLKIVRPQKIGVLYDHVARKHNNVDRERYKLLAENNWKLIDLSKTRPDLIHHDPAHFANRYTVQSYDKPGTTIVAHLFKDGNLFIHPDPNQERTFTPREAARIQSFPDDFVFCGSRTEQYKQIGNAVPPLFARLFAKALKEEFEKLPKEAENV